MYKKSFLLLFISISLQNYCFSDYSDFIWSKISNHAADNIGKSNNTLFGISGYNGTTQIHISKNNGETFEVFFEGQSQGSNFFPQLSNMRIVNKGNSKGIFFYCAKPISNIYGIVYTDFEVQGQLKVYQLYFPIRAFDCDVHHNAVIIRTDSSVYFSNDSMRENSWKKIFKDDVFEPVKVFIHDENNIGLIAKKTVAERKFEHKYFYTNDAGETWQDVDLTFNRGYNTHLDNLEFISGKVGYINGWGHILDSNYHGSQGRSKDRYDYVFKTTDGGQTWHKILDSTIITRDSISPKTMPYMHIYDENTLIIYGWEVYYTQDGGETWHCFALDYEGKFSGLHSAFLNSNEEIYAFAGSLGGSAPSGLYKWHKPSSIPELLQVIFPRIYPNPTSNSATLTVDLATAGNLTVTLNNLLGQELLEIHSGFTDTGTFIKTFSIETLPKGVYYLKITHNGNVTVEKVVRK